MKTTIETNQEIILNSKQFVKGFSKFDTPLQMLEPVITSFGTEGLSLQGTHADTVAENNLELTAFGRVAAIKTIAIDGGEELNYQIGFIYSLEQSKPFVKVFSGVNVKVCTNLCVFNPSNIAKFFINDEGQMQASYARVEEYISNLSKDVKQAIQIINTMKNTPMNKKQVNDFFGQMLRNFTEVKNAAGKNCILSGMEHLCDKSSIYFFEQFTNTWNVYNAITHDFAKTAHIIDQPDKVLAIYNEMLKFADFSTGQTPLQLEYNEAVSAIN